MWSADGRDLAAALAGDREAFGRLYDRHAAVVLALCRTLSASEAEDALQETFLRAHRNLSRVEGAAKLRPWLYAIARRVCSEHRRAGGRRRRHEEASAVTAAIRESGALTDAASCAQRQEQLRLLGAALDQLEDRQRLAIHLYYLEPDPVRAAESALGLSRSGYYKLLARARERLVELMSMKLPS
jgi:RNA polymerase sigma-70 factor (ECF subfamily)